MASRLSSTSVSLEIELTKAGEKLLHLPSSTEEIIKSLVPTEKILSRLPQSASVSMIKSLQPIIKVLIAEDLASHSDMDVKISVACCICEIMRIMSPNTPYDDNQMKEFFELLVTAFEKVSSSSGGCYTKMIKVLKALSSGKLVVMMCDLQLEGLIVRLFKQFLTVADSNSSAVVSKMEKIMTMIIKESKELPYELVKLLAMSGKSNNEIASPVRTELARKALNYADQLNPDIPDMTVRRCLHSQSEMKHEKESLSIVDTPMQSKSVTKVKGKRKKNAKQIQSAELGENLVGSRIKVWWPEDNAYYEGIVKSFQSHKKKHKVWYDDGDKELLDLKTQQWELDEEVSPMSDCQGQVLPIKGSSTQAPPEKISCILALPIKGSSTQAPPEKISCILALPEKGSSTQAPPEKISCILALPKKGLSTHAPEKIPSKKVSSTLAPPEKVSSTLAPPEKVLSTQAPPMKVSTTQSGLKCVQGYKVRKSIAPILEAILKKYGDIASDCVFKTPSVRASILEVICEVFIRIQTNDVTALISEMEDIECQVSAAEVNKINVSWLRQRLDAIHNRTEIKEKCSLLCKGKADVSLVNRAAKRDLEEAQIELVTAQERFRKAERCVEVLKLVEKRLKDSFLEESKAELDSLITVLTQPVL